MKARLVPLNFCGCVSAIPLTENTSLCQSKSRVRVIYILTVVLLYSYYYDILNLVAV